MKKILVLVAALLLPISATAAPVSSSELMGLGMPAALAGKVSSMSNAASGGSVDIGVAGTTELSIKNDELEYTGTAFQIAANTADAADTSAMSLAGGGVGGATRGGYIDAYGNEVATVGGSIQMRGGDVATATVDLILNHASSTVRVKNSSDAAMWSFENDGDLQQSATAGGDIILSRSGKTLAIDSGTAASACKGTGTFNGTTAVVVSTTCAATGALVLITPTSDPTGSTAAYCWLASISNGVSFTVDCDQANDGTFAWLIVKEG